jgi:hypothetical protein
VEIVMNAEQTEDARAVSRTGREVVEMAKETSGASKTRAL